VLVVLTVEAARIRLLNVPLERDEGEYAYMGQLMLQGIPPYQLAANMKFPGTHAAYALIMAIFGQTTVGIHVGFLLVNAGAVVLVFFLGKRLLDTTAGLVAAASYAVLSIGWSVLGMAAHATHFVVLPALGATLLLLQWSESRRPMVLFASGLLYGVAVLMKQPGLFFAVFGGLYVIWIGRRERERFGRLGVFGTGVALPLAVTCLILWRAGVFATFWFWTVSYGSKYGTVTTLSEAAQNLGVVVPNILEANWGIWLLAAAGLVLAWRNTVSRGFALFASALVVCSLLAVSVGFYFRDHYFVLLLPAVALLAGAAVHLLQPVMGRTLPALLVAGALLFSLIDQRRFLFEMSPAEVSRELHGPNPFPEAAGIAEYIAGHSGKDARLAVLGSEPEIFFLARRHSATSYIYTYGLMEPQPYALQMQNEMIRDLEAARPEYVVVVNIATSWLKRPASPTHLEDWWGAYGDQHYQVDGIVDIVSPDHTEYRWGAAAAGYAPQSQNTILVVKRRGS
jgi:hypothetical protein